MYVKTFLKIQVHETYDFDRNVYDKNYYLILTLIVQERIITSERFLFVQVSLSLSIIINYTFYYFPKWSVQNEIFILESWKYVGEF